MNPQSVSLADELRKLEERWREKAETLSRADLQLHGYHQNEISRLIVCADELSALLDQHAVAEPQTPVDEPKNDERGYGCHNCGKQGLKKGQRVSFVYCNECVGVGIDRHAHAAEQPKLTEEQVQKLALEMVEKDVDGSFSYNCPKHGLDSGCKCPESDYRRALEKARGKVALNVLLTSPVAPPPPVYFSNSHAVWDVSKIPAELVYPPPAVPADYHCTFCDGNHFENLCPNRCKPEDAEPPVAPGEQPPLGRARP